MECELGPSGLGGRFTTVEGILTAIKEQLIDNNAVFQDSADVETKNKIDEYEINLLNKITIFEIIFILFLFK